MLVEKLPGKEIYMSSEKILLKGRVINSGTTQGEAFVLDKPFSFIGDFDPDTGILTQDDSPLNGKELANKILVCPTGKGGTIAPFIAYNAKQNGKAPAAILCSKVEPLLAEAAITIDIPIIDNFDLDPVDNINTGQKIKISENGVVESL